MTDGIGPVPGGGYPVPKRPTYPGSTRERWAWTVVVVAMGLLVAGLLVFGLWGGPSPQVQQVSVADVLSGTQLPAERFGTRQIEVVGWYAAVTSGCTGTRAAQAGGSAWLAADCPLRVLVAQQPSPSAAQSELAAGGLRLAAPTGEPFPPPARSGGGTAALEQLVFTGHFDDAAAAGCPADLRDRCRNTFVVTGYVGLIR